MTRTIKLLCLCVLLVPVLAQAKESKHERRGATIGFAAGPGLYYLDQQSAANALEQNTGIGLRRNLLRPGFISDFHTGYFFNPKIALVSSINIGYFPYSYSGTGAISGATVNGSILSYTFLVSAQWYVLKDLYIRPGVGFGFAHETDSISTGGVTASLSGNTSLSLAAAFALGYDFWISKRFTVSPELVYKYLMLPESNYPNRHLNTFGAQASLTWYL